MTSTDLISADVFVECVCVCVCVRTMRCVAPGDIMDVEYHPSMSRAARARHALFRNVSPDDNYRRVPPDFGADHDGTSSVTRSTSRRCRTLQSPSSTRGVRQRPFRASVPNSPRIHSHHSLRSVSSADFSSDCKNRCCSAAAAYAPCIAPGPGDRPTTTHGTDSGKTTSKLV